MLPPFLLEVIHLMSVWEKFNTVNDQDGRLARLEQVIATDDSETGPSMYFADKNSELQSQIDVLRQIVFQ